MGSNAVPILAAMVPQRLTRAIIPGTFYEDKNIFGAFENFDATDSKFCDAFKIFSTLSIDLKVLSHELSNFNINISIILKKEIG